jgi:transposase-like protein
MNRRRLAMTGVITGSMVAGALIGAVVFAPGLGLAAPGLDTEQEVAAACVGVLGAGPVGAAAEAIGIEPSALLAAIRGGHTVAEVAQAHGVDPEAVVAEIVADANERLDQAVADGMLTQEQADERKTEIEQHATDFVNGDLSMPFHPGPPLVGNPGLWGFADGPLAAAADAIGIEPSELFRELRTGATIADVANDHGVEVSTVVDAVVAALQERLDSAVENGWITQAQADERATGLEDEATALVNGDLMPFPFPHPGMPGGPDVPDDGSGASGQGSSTTQTSQL